MTYRLLAIGVLALLAMAPTGPVAIRGATATSDALVVWVRFRDKGAAPTAEALADLQQSFHPRALARRRLRRTSAGLFDERDLPVDASYLQAVRATGAHVRVTSRWLNAVSVVANTNQRARLDALPFVTSVEPVRRIARPRPRDDGGDAPPPSPPGPPPLPGSVYGASDAQLQQINLVALHDAGLRGAGVVVGILDTGFNRVHAAYNHLGNPLQVVAEWDFVNDDANTAPEAGDLPNQHHHGTYILGTLGAYLPGSLVGGAYEASFILAKVEDLAGEYQLEEDLFAAGLEFIEANGGDVATSSLVINGFYSPDQLDGETSIMAQAFNAATDNGLHCFQGAGNSGHDANPLTAHLVPPADAFDVVTVGAVDVNGTIAAFSSDGPTADGRLKPEVLARGVQTATTDPDSALGLAFPSGTSLSTPLAAAATACLVQAHPDWTVSQMRSALFQTAGDFVANGEPDPLFVRGYGILDALSAWGTNPSAADLNGDFVVDQLDLLELLGAWGPCPPPPDPCPEDLDGDGDVGITDLLILLANWT
jgi:hypothetical protein